MTDKKYNNLELKEDWLKVTAFLEKLTTRKPADVNTVLYTIGVQELGKGILNFSKDEKQDIIHIGTCAILSPYYQLISRDADGWPHYKQIQEIPFLELKEQVAFLRKHIIDYFYTNNLIE